MKKALYLLSTLLIGNFYPSAYAQIASEWTQLAGPGSSYAVNIEQVDSDRILLFGSANPDLDDTDLWLEWYDLQGEILGNQQVFGGSGKDIAREMILSPDGSITLLVSSTSTDWFFTPNQGQIDAWVMHFSPERELLWMTGLGGSLDDVLLDFTQNETGDFYACGYSESADGDLPDNQGQRDAWVVKLSADGDLLWTTTIGDIGDDVFTAIELFDDGRIALAGHSNSRGNFINVVWQEDVLYAILEPSGDIQFVKTAGGSGIDKAIKIGINSQDRIIIGGETNSHDGDVSNYSGYFEDIWLIQVAPNGDIEQDATLNVIREDILGSMKINPDNTIYLASDSHVNHAFWLIDTDLNPIWRDIGEYNQGKNVFDLLEINEELYFCGITDPIGFNELPRSFFGKLNFEISTSTDPLLKSEINIYPIPASHKLFIETGSTISGDVNCQLFNTSGVEVANFVTEKLNQGERIELPLTELAPGPYFLLISRQGETLFESALQIVR